MDRGAGGISTAASVASGAESSWAKASSTDSMKREVSLFEKV